ncbi:hypothetical protein ACJX0J_035494, partial [Zea mays]
HIIPNGLIILQYKSEIAPIFVINGDEETTTNFYFAYEILSITCFKHKLSLGLYFILVKDARIKNWQLFDGYHFAVIVRTSSFKIFLILNGVIL